ncbi:MAG: hypothetical protein EOO14_22830 [Chitinophagaceae bacterium]|nr:MAG: hypothetical protein EOO14_22830 [Chitinophagaceae bacterium]
MEPKIQGKSKRSAAFSRPAHNRLSLLVAQFTLNSFFLLRYILHAALLDTNKITGLLGKKRQALYCAILFLQHIEALVHAQ